MVDLFQKKLINEKVDVWSLGAYYTCCVLIEHPSKIILGRLAEWEF